MSTQNVELGNAWQLMRKKRIVSLVTLPHWSKADKDMRQQADFRLWCLRQPIGYFRPYQVGSEFSRGGVNTIGYDDLQRIRYPDMDRHGDPLYEHLSKEKDELLNSEFFDADKLNADGEEEDSDDSLSDRAQIEIAQELRNGGDSLREIADDSRIDYKRSWVREHTTGDSDKEKSKTATG